MTPKLSSQKKLFMVLGFARSGTSVITRSLNALGIDLGDRLVSAAQTNRWNPTGFFEDKDIVYEINAKVFAALGHEKRSIKLIDETLFHTDKLNELKLSAIGLLNKRFATTDYWGFKDPQVAKIVPFWQSLCETLQLQDHYIIALRNPLACAKSYSDLTTLDFELGLILWLIHIISAVNQSRDKKTIIVNYELMMQNPLHELHRLRRTFNLPVPEDHPGIDVFVNQFLDKKLQHNQFSEKDLFAHEAMRVAPLCIPVFEVLLKVARDEMTFSDPEFITQWNAILQELEKSYPYYSYMDTILRKNKQLRRTLRAMNKSTLWKLLYPFRLIDDALRVRRMQKRIKNRIVTAYE